MGTGALRSLTACALALLVPVIAHASAPGREAGGFARSPGFRQTVVAGGLDRPVCLALAPGSRLFVGEQDGAIRIVRGGRLLARPLVVVSTRARGEEGVLGLACDPGFARNRRLYVCYTALEPTRHNRVVRYIVSGDTVLAGSARTLFDCDDNGAHIHVGGGLKFGADGMLYLGTGDNDAGAIAQDLHSTHGKVLRFSSDGAIPGDNPFVRDVTGRHRAIWARGFRNAFRLDVQPGTGRVFVNDVGANAWEEVNDVVAGANHGWPYHEGPKTSPPFTAPVHAYDHTRGCAIGGGAFYDVRDRAFPERWRGGYFFADYCSGELRWLDPAAPARSVAVGTIRVPGPVDLAVGADGALYVLARGDILPAAGPPTAHGAVVRITWQPGR